jgi:multiple antibiotic resistance protein
LEKDLQAIATLFSLVNPLMCAAIFMRVEKDRTGVDRIKDATTAILVIAVVLLVAAFLGARILSVFGVSLNAFSVAGGGVLAWIGISMLTGNATPTTSQDSATGSHKSSLAPLILFAASPGTITGVITIAASHTGVRFPTTATIAIVLVLAVTWIVLVLTEHLGKSKDGGIGRDMVTRYMGLVVLAMGIQFVLTGYKAFMAAA